MEEEEEEEEKERCDAGQADEVLGFDCGVALSPSTQK